MSCLVTSLLACPGVSSHCRREGGSHLSCPLPTEPLGEDEGDGPGDSSEAATDEDRLDSLEVPEAAEGECMP